MIRHWMEAEEGMKGEEASKVTYYTHFQTFIRHRGCSESASHDKSPKTTLQISRSALKVL